MSLAPAPRVEPSQAGAAGWLQYVFPLVGSLGGLLFIVTNPKPLFLASGLLFMLGSIGMGIGMGVQQRMSLRRRIRHARANYLDYLGNIRAQLRKTAAAQRTASTWRHPYPAALLSIAMAGLVWEWRKDDADFLSVRAGLCRQPIATPINVPRTDGLGPTPDPVCEAAIKDLLATYGEVAEVALTVDLAKAPTVTVSGSRPDQLELVRAMICQLAVAYGPDDVALSIHAAARNAPDWDWVKWLPHVDQAADSAWHVQVVDGVDSIPRPGRQGSQIVLIDPSREHAGGNVHIRVQAGRLTVDDLESSAPAREGLPDRLGLHVAETIARRLAPLRVQTKSVRTTSEEISLASLLGIADLNLLKAAKAWRPRQLAEMLNVPIGTTAEGETVRLDFKEAALGGHGPHGLVIGATGSGKSELLRTIVTGLALTHPPDKVAFVLVDFKGGAAFAGLQNLPHVAGLITNLADDLALVDRMHAALFGEIRRRQELLRAAGNLATVRDYHQKLDAGEKLPPLPYLLLIVDEFGELLTARPDFIDLFVAVGRLGRSLGMHLLLASQQLDEGRLRGLEGHLSYRIALRTFSAAESRTVLGVPDAYELPSLPGYAYFKVGTTVYTKFRAALISQPYRPPARTKDVARARVFSMSAEADRAVDPQSPPASEAAAGPSMLELAVARMRDAAPRVHQVWLPPLETRVSLGAVLGKRQPPMVVPLGLVDRPAEQTRGVLMADLSGSAGHLLIVGTALTGKTTLLRTLVCAFALTHSPLEAQFYGIDFGGGGLAPLAALPHVGGVAGRQDPERVRRTVAEIASLLDEREARFAAAGIDSPSALRARRGHADTKGADWADVFLVIDNWPAVRQEFEDLEPAVNEISARGLGYGVHVILTASRWNDIRSALRESIGGRLELRLNDPAESAIDRREAANVAAGVPGRGLTGEGLHFQAALPRIDGSVEASHQQPALEELIEKVNAGWDGPRAKPVLVLPRMIKLSDLSSVVTTRGVPVGVAERDLKPVSVDLAGGDPHFLVFGDGESGKTNFLRTYTLGLIRTFSAKQVQVLVVDYRRTLLGVVPADYLLGYSGAEPAASAQIAETSTVLTRRLPPAELSMEQLRTRSWWSGPDVYVLVDDYDLVVTPSGNPLAPLLPLLAQAKDVGLHIVLARRAGGAGRGALEPVLLRLRELGSPGLLLSGDPQEGPLLGAVRATPQPAGRGLLVKRHEKPALVQIAFSGSVTR